MRKASLGLRLTRWTKALGPGLITGAADDDPSGIATYSQAGAQYGFALLWTILITYPLMAGIQIISARVGRVTGVGLSTNLRLHYPAWLLYGVIGLLLIANTINIAADISAMGASMSLMFGGPVQIYAVGFGVLSLALQILIPYNHYVRILKWLTLALLAYVGAAFIAHTPWLKVVHDTVLPHILWSKDYITTVVAVFGTTISPYLFFWQASQEVEELNANPSAQPLIEKPAQARSSFRRIGFDTWIGMGFSNLVAFFIIVTTAVTLNAHGVHDIQTSSQAAEALRPIAGDLAFYLFGAGIIGTGLLAVPVLAGSAAYAIAGAFSWQSSLELKFQSAKKFYSIIALSTLSGVGLGFAPIDPIKALFLSAVVNGVISVPIMVVMMLMASRATIMKEFVLPAKLRILGWLATALMAAAAIAMLVTLDS
jgi:NRAMP (natural resistance-associated macrophage protein)-like metal ion transporter